MKATNTPQNSKKSGDIRTYQWTEGGRECISVTSVRSLVGVPYNLMTWKVNGILDRVFDLNEFAEQAAINGADGLRRWLREGDLRLTDSRSTEAERGTAVHQAIELDIPPDECTEEVRPYIVQYRNMKRVIGFDVLLQERQVWNLSAGYAGTFDAIVSKKDGSLVLVDWKTAKDVYLDYVMQAHAYLAAEFVGNDGVIDQQASNLLHSTRRGAVAVIQPTGWAWHEFDFNQDVLQAWFGALIFARFQYDHLDITSLIHSTKGKASMPA
jgi:hypothetical protein